MLLNRRPLDTIAINAAVTTGANTRTVVASAVLGELFIPTVAFTCGFECGDVGTGAATSPEGRHWQLSSGSPSLETTTVRNGSRAVRFPTAGATTYLGRNISGAPNLAVARFAIRFVGALPSTNVNIFAFTTGGSWCFLHYISASQKLGVSASSSAASVVTGPVVVADTWYVIDFKADISANPWKIDWRVDFAVQPQKTNAAAANTFTTFRIGANIDTGAGTPTYDLLVDDIIVSTGSALDYPFGEGKVVGLRPTMDGTHSFTTGTFKYDNSTNVAPAATDVNTYVDDNPITGLGEYISQNVVAAEYIEVGFSTPPDTGVPRGVEVVASHHASSTTAHAVTMRLNDGNIFDNVYLDADLSNTTITYWSKQFQRPPSGGLWTYAKLGAVKVRWGYATNVGSIPFLDGVMLEVEYAPGGIPTRLHGILGGGFVGLLGGFQ